MKHFPLLAVVAIVALAAPDHAELQSTGEALLKQLDAHQYAESWTGASGLFQSQISQEQWEQAMKTVREPLGSLASRKFLRLNLTKALAGAADGDYAVMQFQSAFSAKAEAIETLTLTLDDRKWKLAGFFIR
jgi:uncharacterized protein DUF4019